ncbi:MAG: hypothetical protein HC860_03825 [Alkalinema sp. RU_4_3]|nr:hypothetical protein [Alkalinema sp. RU_4_3]
MKAAYLVTETEEAAHFLKQLLPAELLQEIEVVSAKKKYSAVSLAGTIMSVRSRPVLLVVDADSDNLAQAKEREQALMGYLLPAATRAPYQVCVAVPSIAIIAQTFAQNPTAAQIHDLQQHPLVQRITQFLSSAFSQAS